MTTVAVNVQVEPVNLTKLAAEVAAQLSDAVKKTSPEEVVRAFTSSFDNPEIWSQFEGEIKDMAKTTRQVREKFADVSNILGEFDTHHYKKKDGSEIGALKPVWDGYHNQYKEILARSMTEAKSLKLLCDGAVLLFSFYIA
ncbi:hypothetical protein BDN72DRAFT_609653 [Pluteus cervinus]|uniref:Uncharacterized protein n=1 Tax=Pluteus cervinus TaxID=181527 RepID=A0ACD3AVZ4_9AGAR|nr:hypothetical protein BDN72DRAFT_609653 [Pluteus cervinus]